MGNWKLIRIVPQQCYWPVILIMVCALRVLILQEHQSRFPANLVTEDSEKNGDSLTEDVLIFTRIPKSGTENWVKLLKDLSTVNEFKHSSSQHKMRIKSANVQKQMVTRILERVRLNSASGNRSSFDAHLYFIDFRNYTDTAKNPIYFSSIRDPIARFVSKFFYARWNSGHHYSKLVASNSSYVRGLSAEEWRFKDINQCVLTGDPECKFVEGEMRDRTTSFDENDLAVAYFCGQHDECAVHGSKWALQLAKSNINKWFPVVAVLERMKDSLQVLEHLLPKFFLGALHHYEKEGEPHKNRGPKGQKSRLYQKYLSPEAKDILASDLHLEYDLYNFALRRLDQQLMSVESEKQ